MCVCVCDSFTPPALFPVSVYLSAFCVTFTCIRTLMDALEGSLGSVGRLELGAHRDRPIDRRWPALPPELCHQLSYTTWWSTTTSFSGWILCLVNFWFLRKVQCHWTAWLIYMIRLWWIWLSVLQVWKAAKGRSVKSRTANSYNLLLWVG